MRFALKRYGTLLLALLLMFITVAALRPLLPIDETRYLSVAWEMHLKQDWILLTMNFEPYHHKPPLLFWLINLSWQVFGVSRWAAMVPLFVSACASIALCRELARRVLPAYPSAADRAPFILMGSVPFVIYSAMVMFDITMMALTMGALIALLSFAEKRTVGAVLIMGLLLGLGVLTKGPVAYLYTLPPMLLGPLWLQAHSKRDLIGWYGGCLAAIVVSAVPVLAWLIPTLRENSDHNFAFWLVWNQTAGRITGNFSGAHIRPFYFYALLSPLLALPWAFLPGFWRGIKTRNWPQGFGFLLCWFVPAFVAFSFISGKQPHYLVPLLPAVIIAIAYILRKTGDKVLIAVTASVLALFCIGHDVAKNALFPAYDLQPVANYIRQHPDAPVAFAGQYHAEFGFLARMIKPVAMIDRPQASQWLGEHPGGIVVMPHKEQTPEERNRTVLDQPYRGKSLAVLQ